MNSSISCSDISIGGQGRAPGQPSAPSGQKGAAGQYQPKRGAVNESKRQPVGNKYHEMKSYGEKKIQEKRLKMEKACAD